MPESLEPRFEQWISLVLGEGDAFDALVAVKPGQLDASGTISVADNGFGLGSFGDCRNIIEEAFADHHDAQIAWTNMLLRAIGDPPLPHPCEDILVDDMGRYP